MCPHRPLSLNLDKAQDPFECAEPEIFVPFCQRQMAMWTYNGPISIMRSPPVRSAARI